jgi:hypothetical protein
LPFNLVYEANVAITVEAPSVILGRAYVVHGPREEITQHAWVV